MHMHRHQLQTLIKNSFTTLWSSVHWSLRDSRNPRTYDCQPLYRQLLSLCYRKKVSKSLFTTRFLFYCPPWLLYFLTDSDVTSTFMMGLFF